MDTGYDVFVSYSSRDRPLVEPIVRRLRAERVRAWFDQASLVAGRRWQEGLSDGLATSSCCAVFVGPGPQGNWSSEEVHLALVRAENADAFRVFIVLLPGVGEDFDAARVSPFLTTRTWVDLRGGVEDLGPLLRAIRGVSIDDDAPAAALGANPYSGLRPFTEQDADRFFGRAAETQQALEKLGAGIRFLAVVGASGSGKSSLVQAGLLPALRRAHPAWTVRVVKPGASPLETLAIRLGVPDPRATRDRLRAAVDELHLAGRMALAEAGDDARILLVVDQFEEVFTRCRDPEERRQFTANLAYAATAPEGRLVVVLTLRADFYSHCAVYPELAQLLAANQMLIGPMGPDALRDAIAEPARRAGGEFEPGLIGFLVDEVAGRPGALPLLEHSLYELWERRDGRRLTLDAYQRTGGVAGAVAHRAEQVYTSLSADEQAIARRVLLRLTEPGQGTEDTRRRAEFTELARSAAEEPAVSHVVGSLADARLLTTADGVVDVSHEALIRGWPRLKGWVDDDREGLRIQRRLAETADEWERRDRDPSLLFRGTRLEEVRARGDEELNARERAFVEASVALASAEAEQARELTRSRRRARRRLLTAGAVTAVAAVALFVVVRQRQEAERESQASAQAAMTSRVGRLIAESRDDLETDLDGALLHALAADHLDSSPATQGALAEALSWDQRARAVLRPSGPPVAAIAGADDGRSAVVVTSDGVVTTWDLDRRRPRDAPLKIGAVEYAAISGDLRIVAVSDAEGSLRVWDLHERRAIAPAQRVSTDLLSLMRISHDGRLLLLQGPERSQAFSIGARGAPVRLRSGGGDVAGISPDGRVLVQWDGDDLVIRRRSTGQALGRVSKPGDRLLVRVNFAPDSRAFFLLRTGVKVDLHRLDGRRVRTLPLVRTPRAISSDGKRLAGWESRTAYDTGAMQVFTRDGEPVGTPLPLSGSGQFSLAGFAGRQLVTGDFTGRVTLWDPDAAPALARPVPHARSDTVAIRADGRELADAKRVFDTVGAKPVRTLEVPDRSELSAVALAPDGRAAGTSADLDETWLWPRDGGRPEPLPFSDGRRGGSAVAFSRDGRLLAVGSERGAIELWDVSGPRPRRRAVLASGPGEPIWSLEFTPDRRALVVAGGGVAVLDLASRRRTPLDGYSVSVGGTRAAMIDRTGRVRLLALPSFKPAGRLGPKLDTDFATAQLSPDGRRLAIGDGMLSVWDVATRSRVTAIEDGGDLVGWAGDRVVTASYDGSELLVWDLSPENVRRQACAVANRTLSRAEWQEAVGREAPYTKLCPSG